MTNNYQVNNSRNVTVQIEKTYAQQTPTGKRIATYILNNFQQLPFDTANSIAEKTGTSGISVGRYLRGLGYRNLEHLKQTLREQSGTREQPWMVTDRLQQYLSRDNSTGTDEKTPLLLEFEALEHVFTLSKHAAFARICERIANAEAVFVVGIQSTRGIAHTFFSQLEYLRPRVFYADGQSGTYVESLNSEFSDPYIIVTDTRAYSNIVQTYCRVACERQLSMALITDIYCHWARDYPLDLLQIKTATGQFWDSLSPLTYLFNLLLSALVARGGEALQARLHANRQLQKLLGQFES